MMRMMARTEAGGKLTLRQKRFADDYLRTGNAALAVRKNYNVGGKKGVTIDNTTRSMASENLAKPNVREYIESKAGRAAEIVYELAEKARNEAVKLNAAKDIQDRAGLKPIEKSMTLNIEIEPSEEIKALAEKLNGV